MNRCISESLWWLSSIWILEKKCSSKSCSINKHSNKDVKITRTKTKPKLSSLNKVFLIYFFTGANGKAEWKRYKQYTKEQKQIQKNYFRFFPDFSLLKMPLFLLWCHLLPFKLLFFFLHRMISLLRLTKLKTVKLLYLIKDSWCSVTHIPMHYYTFEDN